MKFSEFKQIVEESGEYKIRESTIRYVIVPIAYKNDLQAAISREEAGKLGINASARFTENQAQAILDFAYTPLEEREDEMKFVVVVGIYGGQSHPNFITAYIKSVDYKFRIVDDIMFTDLLDDQAYWFTEREIDNLKDSLPNDALRRIVNMGKIPVDEIENVLGDDMYED